MTEFKMLDLFSGLGGASQAMEEDDRWEVTTVDFKKRFEPDICKDVLELKPEDFEKDFDLVWASPPCTQFTVARVYDNWKKTDSGLCIPQNKKTIEHIKLVYHTLWLINGLEPDHWFLENPKGMLRNVIGEPRGTITYCQYGFDWMKPTDLWGKHPDSFRYKSCSPGDSCHQEAGRGFDSGTQSSHIRDPAERSKVPRGVSRAVKEAVENPQSKKQTTLDKL